MSQINNGEIVESMFTLDSPLGPLSTPLGEMKRARSFHDLLFDNDNALGRRSVQIKPSLLIGRRGSGKTALLYHLYFANRYTHEIVVDSAQVFHDVSVRIKHLFETESFDHFGFVENVGKIWRAALLTSAISAIYRNNKKSSINDDDMKTMLDFLELSGTVKLRSLRSILISLSNLAKNTHDSKFMPFFDFFEENFVSEIGFEDAVKALVSFMNRTDQNIIILIDSMEQFPIHNENANYALGGLLHAIGRLRLEYLPVHVCFCLPSEIYEHVLAHSSNPEKDLGSRIFLHWRAHEILKLCAHRFDRFISASHLSKSTTIEYLPSHPNKEQVQRFWYQFLPRHIENRLGLIEETIPYILRHTQILPRHLVGIINEVVRLTVSNGDQFDVSEQEEIPFAISEDDLHVGVRRSVESICNGIISSYAQVHREARVMCDNVLPHLSNIFSMGEFQVKLRNHGKGVMSDYQDAFRMFKEIGAIGIVEKETEKYFVGQFEYTTPGTLAYSEDDQFCVHPAFGEEFRVGRNTNGWQSSKAIYPLGTDLDDDGRFIEG